MFKSIIEDIKATFRTGNMVTRILVINIAVYVVFALLHAFTRNAAPGFYPALESWFSISGVFPKFLIKPWTFFTYSFMHAGLGHLFWNMVGLWIFGRIVGDLLGDRRILPLYFIGALMGALFYLVAFGLFTNVIGTQMVGASAAIMCIAAVAGITAPDYEIRLILLGNVKIKWIVGAFIFFDLIGTQGMNNSGGHYAHLGGLAGGMMYMYFLRNGRDMADFWNNIFDKIINWNNDRVNPAPTTHRRKAPLKVEHRSAKLKVKRTDTTIEDPEEYLDYILFKIKKKGIDSLTNKERTFLEDQSKQ